MVEKGILVFGFIGFIRGRLIFYWEDFCYDIKIKGEEYWLFDYVDVGLSLECL